MIQGFPTPGKYKVLVRCNTYNQAKYIKDALKSFSMQSTNFPFLTYVMDDASKDGEQAILREWINEHCNPEDVIEFDNDLVTLLMAKDKDNVNCIYAIHLLKKNLYCKPEKREIYYYWQKQCKYEARCEGDDYWTDTLKLQKQVDVLDSHPELSLCFHSYKIDYTDGNSEIKHYYQESRNIITAQELIQKNIFPKVVTMMFDIEKYGEGYLQWCKGSPVGDFPMCLQLYLHGNAAYIHEPMSAYRLNAGNSWTSSINKSFKKRYKHRKALNNVWRQFDEVSKHQYTKIIKKEIRKRNAIFLANIIKLCLNKITFGLVMKIEPVIRRFFKI